MSYERSYRSQKFELDLLYFSQFKTIFPNEILTSKEHTFNEKLFLGLPVTCLLFLLVFNVCRFLCSVNVNTYSTRV